MRLIDADKLKQHYSWWAFQDYDLRIQKDIFDDIVDVQPTIESRPKGEWIDKGFEEYYCSNCSTKAEYYIGQPFGKYEIFQILSDFCPNCGADMRGEEWT